MPIKYAQFILFLVGALIKLDVNIGGRLAVGELLLIAIFPFAISTFAKILNDRQLRWFIVGAFAWMIGAALSDFIVGNSFEYFLKGFIRPVLCLITFVDCYYLSYKNPKNLYAFFFGLLISGIWNIISPTDFRTGGNDAIGTYQYYAYAYTPFFIALASVGGYYLAKKSLYASVILCLVLGVIVFPIMSRTTASVLLISGIVILLSYKSKIFRSWKIREIGLGKIFLSGFILYCLIFYPYVFLAKNGYIGERQQDKFEAQYYKSELVQNPIGFLFAGRMETVGAMIRVANSPIVGNGSWPKRGDSNLKAAQLVGFYPKEVTNKVFDPEFRDPGHSVLFGIWSQSGILVVPFLLMCFVFSLKLLKYVFLGYDYYLILIIPYIFQFLYSFVFNNFNSVFRVELVLFPLLYVYYSRAYKL